MRFELEVPLPPTALSPNAVSSSSRFARAGAYHEYEYMVAERAWGTMQATGWRAPAYAEISLVFGVKRGPRGQCEICGAPRPTRAGAYQRCRVCMMLLWRYAPEDWDNGVAAFKAGQDGLVLAGILPDDSRKFLRGRAEVVGSDGPWVRVVIEARDVIPV